MASARKRVGIRLKCSSLPGHRVGTRWRWAEPHDGRGDPLRRPRGARREGRGQQGGLATGRRHEVGRSAAIFGCRVPAVDSPVGAQDTPDRRSALRPLTGHGADRRPRSRARSGAALAGSPGRRCPGRRTERGRSPRLAGSSSGVAVHEAGLVRAPTGRGQEEAEQEPEQHEPLGHEARRPGRRRRRRRRPRDVRLEDLLRPPGAARNSAAAAGSASVGDERGRIVAQRREGLPGRPVDRRRPGPVLIVSETAAGTPGQGRDRGERVVHAVPRVVKRTVPRMAIPQRRSHLADGRVRARRQTGFPDRDIGQHDRRELGRREADADPIHEQRDRQLQPGHRRRQEQGRRSGCRPPRGPSRA